MTHPIGVDCESCGLGKGVRESENTVRCLGCGRFAEYSTDYCAKHSVNLRRLSGRSKCPYCREEERIEGRRREQQQRRADPQMHNMVDAQANAIDHSGSRRP